MDDDQFRSLLDQLSYSWKGYRKVRHGVKKRIRRHMQRLGCRDIMTYLNLLGKQQEIREECELLMTVSISRFFRDQHLWELMELKWLPDLVDRDLRLINVWSAGCASGEEVYSFKIIWERLKDRYQSLPQLKILASDRNPQYLDRAGSGIYAISSLKEVPPDVRAHFFNHQRDTKRYRIKDDIKKGICWEIRHLLVNPPNSVFDIIFLRNNILTYCKEEIQIKMLPGILECLAPGGLFIIGCHECLPLDPIWLSPVEALPYVFKKAI
ncbi:MAG: CheR family methyltransferase [Desulfobacterales bacterium]|jgi:chemotaxis methyl-accepting protein methylase